MPGKDGDDPEGAEGHYEVSQKIKDDRCHPEFSAREEGHEEVAHVGYGGICQQALYVILEKGQKVPRKHGGYGDAYEENDKRISTGHVDLHEITEQDSEDCAFGDGGNEGRHRRGSALVNIRHPQMEWDESQLEAYPDNDEGRPCKKDRPHANAGSHLRGEPGEFHGSRLRIDEGHPENEEG